MKPLAQVSVLQTNDDRHKNNTDEHLDHDSSNDLDEMNYKHDHQNQIN